MGPLWALKSCCDVRDQVWPREANQRPCWAPRIPTWETITSSCLTILGLALRWMEDRRRAAIQVCELDRIILWTWRCGLVSHNYFHDSTTLSAVPLRAMISRTVDIHSPDNPGPTSTPVMIAPDTNDSCSATNGAYSGVLCTLYCSTGIRVCIVYKNARLDA